jgi:hypothetical protein
MCVTAASVFPREGRGSITVTAYHYHYEPYGKVRNTMVVYTYGLLVPLMIGKCYLYPLNTVLYPRSNRRLSQT